MPEAPFTFRHDLAELHRPGRRDPDARVNTGEVEITSAWCVTVPESASQLVRHAAADLVDYLRVSMDVHVGLVVGGAAPTGPTLALSVAEAGGDPRGYTLDASESGVALRGNDERGAAQACYHVEDLMNLRGGPFLPLGETARRPLFSRWTHSGWGLDDFPDDYLDQVAHAGMDAILVFAVSPNHTPDGLVNRHPEAGSRGRFLDFSQLVERCDRHGLDVYLYSYVHDDLPHPDDPGAQEAYDASYGALFESCPGAKGIVLVGESVEFRSRDPKTSGRLRLDPPDPAMLPDDRPTPGWWPCTDYPRWVERVRDACRRHNADADVVFWTYNWGWAPEEDRLALIAGLPQDVRLHATFEMFESFSHDGVRSRCVDYTASRVGPGPYFSTEAKAAHERGMALSAMVNTGGKTWDFGTAPFQPIPQQWLRRHQAIVAAHDAWGLDALMENHHYGWFPSFVSDLAKWSYWTPSPSGDDMIAALARRDFGAGAESAIEGWRRWSDASRHYVPTDADQYGPCRIGPAYPFTLFGKVASGLAVVVPGPIPMPSDPEVMFGPLIVITPYRPDAPKPGEKTAIGRRIVGEIASFERMLQEWREGTELVARAAAEAPERLRREAERLVGVGRYIETVIVTTVHCKKWWLAETRLLTEADPAAAGELLDDLVRIGAAERENCERAIALLEADSRLGWEPSMGYLGDADHVRWKMAHLEQAVSKHIPEYRSTLSLS